MDKNKVERRPEYGPNAVMMEINHDSGKTEWGVFDYGNKLLVKLPGQEAYELAKEILRVLGREG